MPWTPEEHRQVLYFTIFFLFFFSSLLDYSARLRRKGILRMMEDPKERDRKNREHIYAVKEQCQKTKDMWSLPIRPYGFWTFERHNAQLFWDAKISQAPGRRDPYDDLLEDINSK